MLKHNNDYTYQDKRPTTINYLYFNHNWEKKKVKEKSLTKLV